MTEPFVEPVWTARAQGVVFHEEGGFTDYGVAKERRPETGACADWLVTIAEAHLGRIALEKGADGLGPRFGWILAGCLPVRQAHTRRQAQRRHHVFRGTSRRVDR